MSSNLIVARPEVVCERRPLPPPPDVVVAGLVHEVLEHVVQVRLLRLAHGTAHVDVVAERKRKQS